MAKKNGNGEKDTPRHAVLIPDELFWKLSEKAVKERMRVSDYVAHLLASA